MSDGSSHYIAGNWVAGGGGELVSHDPATGEPVWTGRAAAAEDVDAAVSAARAAQPEWEATDPQARIEVIEAFVAALEKDRDAFAELISRETGKPRWESQGEVGSMIAKAAVTGRALGERRGDRHETMDGGRGVTRYRAVGVLCVFGPFNFPGHIANGQIMPALMAGNTVVLKPSQFTPGVGVETARLWEAAGLPPGVLNVVNGGAETGRALTAHGGHDGVLFTGSYRTGRAIAEALADRPHLMLALEMGGNNPLVVDQVGDIEAAAYTIVQSAYLSGGQRCTCARRLIVPRGDEGDRVLARVVEMIGGIRVGAWDDEPQPLFGPLVHEAAALRVLDTVADLGTRGGRALVEPRRLDRGPCFVTPALVDVTGVADRADEEVFGPLLQVVRVDGFDAALDEANATAYGLAAGLLSDSGVKWERFVGTVRAGVVNWNRQTTGASGLLPFGGMGRSGNHRPAGYFAVDSVTDPVASLENEWLRMPDKLMPGIDL